MNANLSALLYLAASVCFILALKGLSSPETSRRGNLYGIAGMVIAIGTTLAAPGVLSYGVIVAGIVIGGAIGTYIALKIQMTALPQLVAAFHSLVGLAAVCVAAAAFYSPADYGIGAAGAGVLFHLASHDDALVGDVAAALCASPSGISGLVSRLEKGGFVAKTPDAGDARAVRLSLTPAGREAVAVAKSVVRELNAEMSDGFDEAELAVISRWLGHITQRLA